MTTTSNLFPNIIGQHPTKRKFEFYIQSVWKDRDCTLISCLQHRKVLAKRWWQGLLPETSSFPIHNGAENATLKSILLPSKICVQFVDMIMTPYMVNTEATFLFDECHMIPKDVTIALLTITNPNKDNRNTFSYDGQDMDIDFRKLTFLFATTEPQEVFHALIDRMETNRLGWLFLWRIGADIIT